VVFTNTSVIKLPDCATVDSPVISGLLLSAIHVKVAGTLLPDVFIYACKSRFNAVGDEQTRRVAFGAEGTGFTVMVNVLGVPEQPFAEGVTVILATAGEVPLLIPVKAAIVLVPPATNPIEISSLAHV